MICLSLYKIAIMCIKRIVIDNKFCNVHVFPIVSVP